MHADIQAVYYDRRWQAGLRSGATTPWFDVGRSSFKTTPYGINATRLQNNLALMGLRDWERS
jgi:hypothetical protein